MSWRIEYSYQKQDTVRIWHCNSSWLKAAEILVILGQSIPQT